MVHITLKRVPGTIKAQDARIVALKGITFKALKSPGQALGRGPENTHEKALLVVFE